MTYTPYIFGILVLVVFIHYMTKIVDWIGAYRRSRYKDGKAEFMSDLFRLQEKWSMRGEVDYSLSIGLVIQAHNLPPEEKQPETDYGKQILRAIKDSEDGE